MPRTTTRCPAESQWEVHRQEIERLYGEANWTQKEVDRFMRRKHGFCASKYQYECRFRAWSLRKKHSPHAWRQISHLMQRGDPARPSSAVTYNGRVIDQRRVEKALSRYRRPGRGEAKHGGMPPGFEIHRVTVISTKTGEKIIEIDDSSPVMAQSSTTIRVEKKGLPYSDVNETTASPTLQNVARVTPQPEAVSKSTFFAGVHAVDNLTKPSEPTPLVVAALHVLVKAVISGSMITLGFHSLGDVWNHVGLHCTRQLQHHFLEAIDPDHWTYLSWMLLRGAIEAGDAQGVTQVIRVWFITVDDVLFLGRRGEILKAIEVASGLGRLDVVEALLAEGADPNAAGFHAQASLGSGGPALYWAMNSDEFDEIFPSCEQRPPARTRPIKQSTSIIARLIEAGIRSPSPDHLTTPRERFLKTTVLHESSQLVNEKGGFV